jgi:hypothetical protein
MANHICEVSGSGGPDMAHAHGVQRSTNKQASGGLGGKDRQQTVAVRVWLTHSQFGATDNVQHQQSKARTRYMGME